MQSHEHRRPPRRQGPAEPLSPEQSAERHQRALLWREAWRAEVAARVNGVNGHAAPPPAPRPKPAAKSSARFASEIARAEFGRFYWKGAPPAALKPAKKADKKADKKAGKQADKPKRR